MARLYSTSTKTLTLLKLQQIFTATLTLLLVSYGLIFGRFDKDAATFPLAVDSASARKVMEKHSKIWKFFILLVCNSVKEELRASFAIGDALFFELPCMRGFVIKKQKEPHTP